MDLEVTVAILDLNGLLIKVERIDKLQLRKIITGVFNGWTSQEDSCSFAF